MEPSEIVSVLARYGPCDLADALVQFGLKSGGFIPNLECRSAGAAAGPAYTVLYAPKDDPRPAVLYIDDVPAGSVLVIGLPLGCQRAHAPYVTVNNALYGGLMSTRAQFRGARGSVVLGRIRDLDEHRALEYPVWSYGVGTTAPGPVCKVVGVNVELEVRVGEDEVVRVGAGDYVVADKNGVVTVGANEPRLREVLEYMPKRVAADERVAEDIKRGEPAAKAQKHWRGKI
jgi:regulator of RNase E activity RraA